MLLFVTLGVASLILWGISSVPDRLLQWLAGMVTGEMLIFVTLGAAALIGAWIIARIVRKRRMEAQKREWPAKLKKWARESAQTWLTDLGISCVSENLDAVAASGLVIALDRGELVGPRADVVGRVLKRIKEAIPEEARRLIGPTQLRDATRILDAGGLFQVVHNPEHGHWELEPCSAYEAGAYFPEFAGCPGNYQCSCQGPSDCIGFPRSYVRNAWKVDVLGDLKIIELTG